MPHHEAKENGGYRSISFILVGVSALVIGGMLLFSNGCNIGGKEKDKNLWRLTTIAVIRDHRSDSIYIGKNTDILTRGLTGAIIIYLPDGDTLHDYPGVPRERGTSPAGYYQFQALKDPVVTFELLTRRKQPQNQKRSF